MRFALMGAQKKKESNDSLGALIFSYARFPSSERPDAEEKRDGVAAPETHLSYDNATLPGAPLPAAAATG